jgi:hypothetical protein
MKIIFLLLLFPVLRVSAQSRLDAKIMEAARQLTCLQPGERNPVMLNAQLVKEGDSMAVIVKAAMAPGWHIYAYVPATLPYIAIGHVLELPGNCQSVGEWQKPEAQAYADDPGVLIYEDEAVFIHKLVKLHGSNTGGAIRAGLYYQTCNLRQCLPPSEKIFELKF